MGSTVRQYDQGFALRPTLVDEDWDAVDVSAATVKKMLIEKPDGTVLEKTANFATDGTDGKIEYTIVAGDVDQVGLYEYQGYCEIGSLKRTSSIGTFEATSVKKRLPAPP